jgi:hypothetical protein
VHVDDLSNTMTCVTLRQSWFAELCVSAAAGRLIEADVDVVERSASFLGCNQLDAGKPATLKMSASTVSLTYCVHVNMRSHSDETGKVMAGKHRAKAARRQTEAYAWLGTGAVTLALGAALPGGVGVAHADTTSSTGSGSRVSPPGNFPQRRLRSVQASARRA